MSSGKGSDPRNPSAGGPTPAGPVGEGPLAGEVERLRAQVATLFHTEMELSKAQVRLSQQVAVLSRLHELGLRLAGSTDARATARDVARFATRDLKYARSLVLADPQSGRHGGVLRVMGHDGYEGADYRTRFSQLGVPIASPIVARIAGQKQLVCSADHPQPEADEWLGALDLAAWIAVPFYDPQGALLGLLVAGSAAEEVHDFLDVADPNTAPLLAALSAQAGAALNASLALQALALERSLLEERVSLRTRDLAEALKKLEALDAAKAVFFANVSHELRTPLTLSIGPIEELLRHGRSFSPGDQERHLRVVYNNQLRLLRLINNLLDFAKIDAGQVSSRFQRTDVGSTLSLFLTTLSSALEGRRIQSELSIDPTARELFVDREKFEAILMNLLSNAFKFTPDGGKIRVRTRTVGGALAIDVSDTGIGIPADALPKLFQRFERVEVTERRAFEGTGLGLAMVKELVQLHGGEVWVRSELGEGSTFTVTIPKGHAHLPQAMVVQSEVGAASEVAAHQMADFHGGRSMEDIKPGTFDSQPAPSEPLFDARRSPSYGGHEAATVDGSSVLVVDDVPEMRAFIADLLRSTYRVRTARDGQEALDLTRAHRPDLIVSDVVMPKMTGLELCETIKRDPGPLATTPVILVSARGELSHRLTGLEHLADDYLGKPFSAEELKVRARNLLRLRKLERALALAEMHAVKADLRVLEKEVLLARRIQMGLLPASAEHRSAAAHVAGMLLDADPCSGDFWRYHPLPDGGLLVLVGEAPSHGLASAMTTQLAHGAIQAVLADGSFGGPAAFLERLNGVLVGASACLTMVACYVDPDGRQVLHASAGHPPMYVHAEGRVRPLVSRTAPLGLSTSSQYADSALAIVGPSRLLLYCAGLLSASNASNDAFGARRLVDVFGAEAANAPESIARLERAVRSFVGDAPLDDDVTAVVIGLGQAS